MLNLTDNERIVLGTSLCEVGDLEYGFSYEIEVCNYSNLDPEVARGSLSSLVQKGYLIHKRVKEDGETRNYYKANPEYLEELTKVAKEECEKL